MKKADISIEIFDLLIFSRSMSRLLRFIAPEKRSETDLQPGLVTIFTPNPEQVVMANESQVFKKTLQRADILIPDGIGLITAQKVLKRFGKSAGDFVERISGRDLAQALLVQAHQNDWKVLIIGGREYAELPQEEYRVQNVGLFNSVTMPQHNPNYLAKKGTSGQGNKAGESTSAQDYNTARHSSANGYGRAQQLLYWTEGYADVKNQTGAEEAEICNLLSVIKPDIVFVALGAPYQEQWVIEHRLQLKNVKIAMVVGGAFDVILGKLHQPPALIQQLGFEWLFRLLQEPHRWRRQLRLLSFIKLVGEKLRSKS